MKEASYSIRGLPGITLYFVPHHEEFLGPGSGISRQVNHGSGDWILEA